MGHGLELHNMQYSRPLWHFVLADSADLDEKLLFFGISSMSRPIVKIPICHKGERAREGVSPPLVGGVWGSPP